MQRTKICAHCGKPFEQGGRQKHNFLRAKYCGRVCYCASKKFTQEQALAAYWSKVDKGEHCWLWTAATNDDGYGHFRSTEGKYVNAHRFSYQLHKGAIPAGLTVMHSCDKRHCVNPDHLSLGTHAQNMADCKAKGRSTWGEKNKRNKLTASQVREIREAYSIKGRVSNTKELAAIYNVAVGTITNITSGRTWSQLK